MYISKKTMCIIVNKVYSSVSDTKFLQGNNRNLQINGIAAARALLVVTAGRTIYGLDPCLSLALFTVDLSFMGL